MKKGILTLIGAFLLGPLVLVGQAAAANVTPTFVPGNPSCQSLGYAYELKPTPENAPNGTYLLSNGVDSVTVDSNATGVDSWSSTIGIDAVIVKGGPNANVYTYNPEATGDTNLVTPTNLSNSQPYGLSHVSFCYDYEVKVSKTAQTTFNRDWSWTVDKVGDQTDLLLSAGQEFSVGYMVTVNATSADSNFGVSGVISVQNPDPTFSATVQTVTDQISGLAQSTPVVCNKTLPATLAPNETLTCTYSQALSDATSRTNTATATTTGVVGGGSGSAAVTFGAPSNETDECINISDDKFTLNPGTLCAANITLPYVYLYSVDVRFDTCGTHQHINTVSFVTNDTQATGSDSWTVNVTIPCLQGCTLTQGYWKTHADPTRKQFDTTWNQLTSGPNTTFFASGKTWLQVFNTAPKGNIYYQLAHQYMAAKLNVLNGAATTAEVQAALTWSESFFGSVTPSTSLTKTQKQQALAAATLLDQYNNGLVGPGHCSE